MKTVSIRSREFLERTPKPSGLDKLARRIVRSRLESIADARVVVTENGRRTGFGELSDAMPSAVELTVRDPRFYSDVAFGGVLGAGESYIHEYWDCDDLTLLVRILLRNRGVLQEMNSGLAIVTQPLQKLLHWLNRNTRKGSRRNISAHYDLGNDFYELWLDSRMMYSSAVFEHADMSLDAAGEAKLDRICRKLKLSPSDRVLEIGTGWGGFAIHAARHYGCRVTTTTISRRQFEYAQAAIEDAGLGDRIELLCLDYRDLEGRYDKLVSIEMIEAVGWQYQDAFFRKCSALLAPHGEMLLQAITIADQHYEQYKSGVDFIRRYIFPGGCLCSVTAMTRSVTRATDMRTVHLEDIGPHYAKTLEHWRGRFLGALDEVRGLGFPEEFVRMWNYYLCYCEGAFIERATGNVQMHLVKPGARADVVGF